MSIAEKMRPLVAKSGKYRQVTRPDNEGDPMYILQVRDGKFWRDMPPQKTPRRLWQGVVDISVVRDENDEVVQR